MTRAKHSTDIRTYIPQVWTMADGTSTGNFDSLSEDIHNAEGWYWCDSDEVCGDNQRLDEARLINNRWIRKAIDKTPAEIAADRKALVPYEVTMRQARIMLLAAGILSQVDEAVAGMDEASKLTWEYSQTVQRANPLVSLIGLSFGLSEEELDTMFIEAKNI